VGNSQPAVSKDEDDMLNRVYRSLKRSPWTLNPSLLVLLLFFTTAALHAQDAPPTRAARLSYLDGTVTLEQAANVAGEAAQPNMPLAQGQRIKTGENGQAEIEFEDGSVVRLTPNSTLSLDSLSIDSNGNYRTQVSILYGLAYAELRAAAKYVYRLNAGGDVLSPVENATIRINLDEPPAAIAVLDGRIRVERAASSNGEGYHTDLRSGETLRADSADGGRYFLTQEIAVESWDKWNEARDQAAADEATTRTEARDSYAGDQGYGWSDLDANGSWYNIPGQGQVWQPNVAMDASWDPYGYGSWVWVPGRGYVWASSYGWGWTPYRCGNWSYWDRFGWGWSPASGCGYGGYGGWGYGGGSTVYVINVVRPPRGYRSIPLPGGNQGPIRVHPIVVARPGRPSEFAENRPRGPRRFGNATVEPLGPVGGGYTPRGGSAVGSSLRRDFPVDRDSHRAVIGTIPTASPVAPYTPSAGNNGGRPTGGRPRPPAPTQTGDANSTGRPAAPPTYRQPDRQIDPTHSSPIRTRGQESGDPQGVRGNSRLSPSRQAPEGSSRPAPPAQSSPTLQSTPSSPDHSRPSQPTQNAMPIQRPQPSEPRPAPPVNRPPPTQSAPPVHSAPTPSAPAPASRIAQPATPPR